MNPTELPPLVLPWGAIWTAVCVLAAGYFALGKLLIAQFNKRLDEKLSLLTTELNKHDTKAKTFEKDLMELRLKLAEEYVRKESIREFKKEILEAIAGLSSKLDSKVSRDDLELLLKDK